MNLPANERYQAAGPIAEKAATSFRPPRTLRKRVVRACETLVIFLVLALPFSLGAEIRSEGGGEPVPEPLPSITPIQLALLAPYQLADEETAVIGLRLNIFYGENSHVYGLDSGLVNYAYESSGGLSIGAVNVSNRHLGVQTGIVNYADNVYGFQLGFINASGSRVAGWQIGLVNGTDDDSFLPMMGLLGNISDAAYLGQYTLGVNVADTDTPLQLSGIGNFSDGDSWVQLAAGINYSDEDCRLQISGLYSICESALVQISGLGSSSDGNAALQSSVGLNLGEEADFQLPGAINVSDKSRLQLALIANASKDVPIQISGGANDTETGWLQLAAGLNRGKNVSLQASLLFNMAEDSAWQVAALNHGSRASIQLGFMNNADLSRFLQLGALNRSELQTGLAIGLVNDAKHLNGFQIGLFNVARNAPIPFLPFFNWYGGETDYTRTGYLDAAWTPIQLSIYMPGQLFGQSTAVRGLRLNLFYGVSSDVKGLDIGLLNWSGSTTGVQAGPGNVNIGDFRGLQLGLTSLTTGTSSGIMIHPLVQYTEGDVSGFALSGAAWTNGDVHGMQLGLIINQLKNTPFPQIGGANVALSAPFQIGWVSNFSEESVPLGQISVFANYTGMDAPYQIALGGNHVNQARFQVSGLYSISRQTDIQLSGLFNGSSYTSILQIAGISNVIRGRSPMGVESDQWQESQIRIAQISAFYNYGDASLQLGAVNFDWETNLIQTGILNLSRGSLIQMGIFNGSADPDLVQLGLVNAALDSKSVFFQLGAINFRDDGGGLMVGVWNMGDEVGGLQIGLFNFADRIEGLQIGLINVHKHGGLPVTLGLNF